MYFFIDTAKIEDIKKANEMGIISGVTTNPSLIAAAGGDFHETVKEIASVIEGPISAEVLADDTEGNSSSSSYKNTYYCGRTKSGFYS